MQRSAFVGAVYPFFAQDLNGLSQQHMGILPWEMVAAVAEGVLGGLVHLHGRGIIHRDIKPGNTLVRPRPHGTEVVISDFGWCKAASLGFWPGPWTPGVVTVPYRAPEIELGCKVYGFPADVWSVGIMLGELCSGRTFAPGSWRGTKPQHCLLIAIDGLSGPLGEDEWPGLGDLPGWTRRGADVILGRKGQPRCRHPFEPSRRLVPEAAQRLTSALLMLRPEKRCSAKDGHAEAVKFLSDVAPRPVARRAVLPARPRVDAASQTEHVNTGEAASQTEHVNHRYKQKRQPNLFSNLHIAVRRLRERTPSGGRAPDSQKKTAPAQEKEKTESARASAQASEETLPAPDSEARASAQASEETLPSPDSEARASARASAQAFEETLPAQEAKRDVASSAAVSQTEDVNRRYRRKRPPTANMAARHVRARTCSGEPAPASQDRTAPTQALEQTLPGTDSGVVLSPEAKRDARDVAARHVAGAPRGATVWSEGSRSSASGSLSPLHTPWQKLTTPLPDPPLHGGKKSERCSCTGRCTAGNRAHSRQGGGRSSCRFAPAEGSKFCDLCRCRVFRCINVQVGGETCRRLDHLFAPYDQELKALVALRVPLSSMDPVDLEAFLLQAPVVWDDIMLLSILADVWEPLPVQCLAQNFESLQSSYTAEDVAQAFLAALDSITSRPDSYGKDDVSSKHYDVLCMGGVCRHFGFRNVGKRLGLLDHVGDGAQRLVARRKKYYLGKSRDELVYTGSTDILQKLMDHRSADPTVMKRAWRKARSGDAEGCIQEIRRWVHNPSVPSELAWGYKETAYHGSHIWRKIWLLMYHNVNPAKWSLQRSFVIDAGPDVGQHVRTLPWALTDPFKLKRAFAPTDPTRIHMWTCLLSGCFQRVEGFRSAWEAGLVTEERWEKARQEETAERGITPHPEWVAERVLRLCPGAGR